MTVLYAWIAWHCKPNLTVDGALMRLIEQKHMRTLTICVLFCDVLVL